MPFAGFLQNREGMDWEMIQRGTYHETASYITLLGIFGYFQSYGPDCLGRRKHVL